MTAPNLEHPGSAEAHHLTPEREALLDRIRTTARHRAFLRAFLGLFVVGGVCALVVIAAWALRDTVFGRGVPFLLFTAALIILVPWERRRWRVLDRERALRHRHLREDGILSVHAGDLPPPTPRPTKREGGRDVRLHRGRPRALDRAATPALWWNDLIFVAIVVGVFLMAVRVFFR